MRPAALDADLARIQGLLMRGTPADVRQARAIATSARVHLHVRRLPRSPAAQLVIDLRVRALDVIVDCPLGCHNLPALVCVARQIASEMELGKGRPAPRSSPAKRGRLSTFVQCRTELCARGAATRRLVGDAPAAVEMARNAPHSSDTAS